MLEVRDRVIIYSGATSSISGSLAGFVTPVGFPVDPDDEAGVGLTAAPGEGFPDVAAET